MSAPVTSIRGLTGSTRRWLDRAPQYGLTQAELLNAAFDALAAYLAYERKLPHELGQMIMRLFQRGLLHHQILGDDLDQMEAPEPVAAETLGQFQSLLDQPPARLPEDWPQMHRGMIDEEFTDMLAERRRRRLADQKSLRLYTFHPADPIVLPSSIGSSLSSEPTLP